MRYNNIESFRKLQFTAIDGEGISVGKEHYYNLLVARTRVENRQIILSPYEDDKRLRTGDILYILSHLPRKQRIFVMFYFSYDITKWLEDLSVNDRIALWKNQQIYWRDDELSEDGKDRIYRLTYMPKKFFKVEEWYNGHFYGNTIYDVFGFFQTSFATALEQWNVGTAKQREFIAQKKMQRSVFSLEDYEEITQYCIMECDLLCQLMEKVRDALADENILISRWHGAGAVGEQLLHRENMQQYIQPATIMEKYNEDTDFYTAIRGAYFGGRFELCRQGIISSTHQYDINSAYPYAMTKIPDLREARIEYRTDYVDAEFSLWRVTYDVRHGSNIPLFGPLPFRKKNGTVLYPYHNEYGVWVHNIELQTAIKLYGKSFFNIHEGYVIIPTKKSSPFRWINTAAAHRLLLKKQGDLRNIALKLGLNSLYGKTAQQLGGKDGELPPFQNYYLAGYITAHCRAQLLQLAFTCGYRGSGVIQFATDGIFSTIPSNILGIQTSEKLGEWEYKYHSRPIIYVQPGVYFTSAESDKDQRKTKRRTRGFNASRLTAKEVFDAWRDYGPFAELSVDDSQFFGIGGCLVYKDWSKYGKWIKTPHKLSFDVPPTKMHISGEDALPRKDMWRKRLFNIAGISQPDYLYPSTNHYILVTDDSHVSTPSYPYPEKRQARYIAQENIDPELKKLRKQEIIDFEQGDYERLSSFNPFEHGM